eukprot:scaffold34850_cov45-Isochrysis_galbana.AAC.1
MWCVGAGGGQKGTYGGGRACNLFVSGKGSERSHGWPKVRRFWALHRLVWACGGGENGGAYFRRPAVARYRPLGEKAAAVTSRVCPPLRVVESSHVPRS